MISISENEKLEYLEKLESQSISLSMEIISQLYKDPDYYIRFRLAQALVNYHNELSANILTYLIYDEEEIVRINACDSLCWSSSKNTLEKLLIILQNDKYLVRGYALSSIADIILNNNYFDYVTTVKNILKYEKSKFVLLYYYSFLYRLGDRAYLFKIAENLNAIKYADRCNTTNLLYYTVNDKDFSVVINLMKNRLLVEKTPAVKSTLQRIIKDLEGKLYYG